MAVGASRMPLNKLPAMRVLVADRALMGRSDEFANMRDRVQLMAAVAGGVGMPARQREDGVISPAKSRRLESRAVVALGAIGMAGGELAAMRILMAGFTVRDRPAARSMRIG